MMLEAPLSPLCIQPITKLPVMMLILSGINVSMDVWCVVPGISSRVRPCPVWLLYARCRCSRAKGRGGVPPQETPQTIAVSNHGNHRKTNDLPNVHILGRILGSYCKYDIGANVISKLTSRCLRVFIGFDKKSDIVTCCCLSILEIILMKKKTEKK